MQLTIGYEWLLFMIAAVTAWVAIKSFLASKRQNELSTVPIILLKSGDGQQFYLENLTNKFAYNVEIEPTYLRNNISAKIYKIYFTPEDKNYLGPKDRLNLKELALEDGAKMEASQFTKIISNLERMSKKKNALVVKFCDSQGIRYFTLIGFLHGTERIILPPTRLTILQQLWLWQRQVYVVLKLARHSMLRSMRRYSES